LTQIKNKKDLLLDEVSILRESIGKKTPKIEYIQSKVHWDYLLKEMVTAFLIF
jgi:hypothetical protein